MDTKFPPSALIVPPLEHTDFLRGAIKYKDRTNNWKEFLPTVRQQKFKFDTNECSQLSGANSVATQFNYLRDSFSIEALQWFSDNGYIDELGKFAFSERFTAILSGTTIDGNSQIAFWDAVKTYGLLPRKDLSYTQEQSNKFSSQEDMCLDYYNRDVITKAMFTKAEKSLDFFKVAYEYSWYNLYKSCPLDLINEELKHAPLHIGTPVCSDWNTGNMKPCGSIQPAHATTLFDQDDLIKSSKIRDQYNPYDKTMAPDYFIPIVMKGVVDLKKVEMLSPKLSVGVWQQFVAILRKIGVLTINGLRGIINR